MSRLSLVSAMLATLCTPLSAHEFWIEPNAEATPATAELRVGGDLSGEALAFFDRTIAKMTHFAPSGPVALSARQGDLPAITLDLSEPGLHRVTVVTQPAYTVLDDLSEFADYLEYEGLGSVAETHVARGLPLTEIAEEYFRNARALIQIGPVREDQADSPTGMDFELVATGSPFAPAETIELTLTWRGNPVPDHQVSLFTLSMDGAAPNDTDRTLYFTNEEGKATIPRQTGLQYLANAVRITEADGPGSVVWRSHWASLSFTIAE